MKLGFATITYKRDPVRLRRLLGSTDCEFVVVDQNTDPELVDANRTACAEYPHVRYLHTPRKMFNKCLGHNVGIRALGTELIGAIDVDMLLPPGFTEYVLEQFAQGCEFLMPYVLWLPEGVDYALPFDGLKKMGRRSHGDQRGSRTMTAAGSPQVAHREWWYNVQGFDEGFKGTLGGTETELLQRARRSFLQICRPSPPEVYVLHQWHPRSKFKRRKPYFRKIRGRTETVVNGEGWGTI